MTTLTSQFSCARRGQTPELRQVRIATGPKDGTFFGLGNVVAALYNKSIPGTFATAFTTNGSSDNLAVLESGAAEFALITSDIGYAVYAQRRATPSTANPNFRGVAVLFPNSLHIFVKRSSAIRNIKELSGHRIGLIAPAALRPESRTTAIMSAIGDVAFGRGLVGLQFVQDVVRDLGAGDIDAGFLYGGYPFGPVTEAATSYGIRLLEIDQTTLSAVRVDHPFFKRSVIPADTYPGQERPVETVAIDTLLVCRADLADDAIYSLTRALYEGLSFLASGHPAGQQINSDDVPATPVPLHPGAARYYREREISR
jgi:hypothetical protein